MSVPLVFFRTDIFQYQSTSTGALFHWAPGLLTVITHEGLHREQSYCHRKPHPQLIMSRGTIVSCTAWKCKELNSLSFVLSSALYLGLFYSSVWTSGMNVCFRYCNCIWNPSLFPSKVKISQSRLHLLADEIASVVLSVLHLLLPHFSSHCSSGKPCFT